MKNTRVNNAVSEVVGTAILLGIAISLFSIVQVIALSFPFNPSTPSARLVGTVNQNTIVIEHNGGESLSLDTEFTVTINGTNEKLTVSDYLNNESRDNGVWNIGERVVYPAGDIADLEVSVTIIDVKSNSIIMSGIITP